MRLKTASWIVLFLFVALPMTASSQEGESPFGLYMSGEKKLIPLPLLETRVRGSVSGFVARVKVTQVYVNPYDGTAQHLHPEGGQYSRGGQDRGGARVRGRAQVHRGRLRVRVPHRGGSALHTRQAGFAARSGKLRPLRGH